MKTLIQRLSRLYLPWKEEVDRKEKAEKAEKRKVAMEAKLEASDADGCFKVAEVIDGEDRKPAGRTSAIVVKTEIEEQTQCQEEMVETALATENINFKTVADDEGEEQRYKPTAHSRTTTPAATAEPAPIRPSPPTETANEEKKRMPAARVRWTSPAAAAEPARKPLSKANGEEEEEEEKNRKSAVFVSRATAPAAAAETLRCLPSPTATTTEAATAAVAHPVTPAVVIFGGFKAFTDQVSKGYDKLSQEEKELFKRNIKAW
jgi:hypothetical protein